MNGFEFNMSVFINSKVPLIIRNKISNWKVLNYEEDDWCNEFENKVLQFRQGCKSYNENPVWEQQCEQKNMTLKEFFELSMQNQDTWLYYDYKYMKDILPMNSKLLDEIKWADLELFDSHGRDSALWIGNEGAHTCCHMDTYGCNFVAQLLGRKLWVLMPPEETESLNPVRVPYEESSIYSSYNFYTPNNNLLKIRKAYKVILSPGDVLFVPRHWWHYVENLDVAISVNIWVPMELDDESRVDESLVRHYISNICQDLTEEEAKQLLNPNEFGLLHEPYMFNFIEQSIENCLKLRGKKIPDKKETMIIDKCDKEWDKSIVELDVKSYISEKSKLHKYDPYVVEKSLNKLNDRLSLAKMLINSYCHPTNVGLVRETLLKQF